MIEHIIELFNSHKDYKKAQLSKIFFKTYDQHLAPTDIFIGISTPLLRNIAKNFNNITLQDLSFFLQSTIHEYRLFALISLVNLYQYHYRLYTKNINNTQLKTILISYTHFYNTYVNYINNWDLVDISSYNIIGHFIHHFNNESADLIALLRQYVKSNNIWKKRIAVVSTKYLIKNQHFDLPIEFITHLLNDKHDLIHKASGWMLREIGNKNVDILEQFLEKFWSQMPRTMLRYAIEKLPNRKYWLNKK